MQDLEAKLLALTSDSRRARLRALMPKIDLLAKQGVGHQEMASTLTTAGITISPPALRQALSRWRRQVNTPAENNSPLNAPVAHHPHTPAGPQPTLKTQRADGGIHSKADLVRLRTETDPPDLDALAALGRQK